MTPAIETPKEYQLRLLRDFQDWEPRVRRFPLPADAAALTHKLEEKPQEDWTKHEIAQLEDYWFDYCI